MWRSAFLPITRRSGSRPTSSWAFLPAMVIGALAHDFIKGVLFTPWVVSTMLVLGGIAILLIERFRRQPTVAHIDQVTPGLALKIGLCQCVAMIPGVSRSGATIMGAMLLGVGREAATEFSFFLAIPTMLAATVYDLYKNWAFLSFDDEHLDRHRLHCCVPRRPRRRPHPHPLRLAQRLRPLRLLPHRHRRDHGRHFVEPRIALVWHFARFWLRCAPHAERQRAARP